MIVVFTGLPGAGKSLKLADTVISLLYQNKNQYKKRLLTYNNKIKKQIKKGKSVSQEEYHAGLPAKRVLWTNLKMTEMVEKEFEGYFNYWADLNEIVQQRDADVIIDEIATYFNARQWELLSIEASRWLAQHRKFGVDIYGTAQDFAQADKAFRRLTSNLLYLTKLAGSRDISPTRSDPKLVWGIVLVQTLDPVRYDEEKSKFTSVGFFPRIMLITKRKVSVFDTRAEVKMSKHPPLKHIERFCELPDCPFHKTVHA